MNGVESPSAPPKSQPAYWILQLTGWGLYSLSRFIAGVWAMNLSWVNFGLQLLCVDAVGFGVSHLLRNYVRHQQWRALPVRKRILPMLAAAFVCGIPLGVLTQFTQ